MLICNSYGLWAQQDPQFSQNMFNQLTVNPAFAGSSNMINLQAISRQQYVGLEGNPKTTVFGADAAISPMGIDGGLGIHFMSDQIGFTNEVAASLSGAIKLPVYKGSLGLGLMVGFRNQVLDPKWYYGSESEQSDFHQNNDPHLVAAKVNGNAMDMGIGAYYSEKNGYLGLSVLHLFNSLPKFDGSYFYYFKRTVFISGGRRFEMIDKPYAFYPSVFVKSDGVSFQTDLNCNVFYKKRYWGGLSYRIQDAIVLIGGLEMKSGLRLGYSFDIPTSRVAKNSEGGHEVTVGYTFEMSIDKKSKRYKSVRYL